MHSIPVTQVPCLFLCVEVKIFAFVSLFHSGQLSSFRRILLRTVGEVVGCGGSLREEGADNIMIITELGFGDPLDMVCGRVVGSTQLPSSDNVLGKMLEGEERPSNGWDVSHPTRELSAGRTEQTGRRLNMSTCKCIIEVGEKSHELSDQGYRSMLGRQGQHCTSFHLPFCPFWRSQGFWESLDTLEFGRSITKK